MRPVLLFAAGAAASLFILGYAVHMLIGGLVRPTMEYTIIGVIVCIGASVIIWMAWDVMRRR